MPGDHITFNTFSADYNGYDFQAISCTGDCKSSSAEPTWGNTFTESGGCKSGDDGKITDNHVTWQCITARAGNHYTLITVEGDTRLDFSECAEMTNDCKSFYVRSDGSLSDLMTLSNITGSMGITFSFSGTLSRITVPYLWRKSLYYE